MILALASLAAAAIALTAVGLITYTGYLDWKLRRELRRLNADPSQHPIGV